MAGNTTYDTRPVFPDYRGEFSAANLHTESWDCLWDPGTPGRISDDFFAGDQSSAHCILIPYTETLNFSETPAKFNIRRGSGQFNRPVSLGESC